MKRKWICLPALLLLMFLAFDMSPVRAEVTSYTRYRQKDTELDKYIYSCLFEINDGEKYAFCIERSKMTPGAGSDTSDWIELFNEDLRKVLYYGYGGPADMGYTVVETSCAAAAANGDNETSIGATVLAEIQLLASPPANFRVWMVETNNGISQDIAFYTTLTTGDLTLEKISENEEITGGNPNYSVAGAVYGVYTELQCENQVGTLTTDENGLSESLTLAEGTYYLKELLAPPGYKVSNSILKAEVLVERTVIVTVSDEPITTPVNILLQKVDADTGESVGQGNGILKGAQFSVRFYAQEYSEEATTEREWVFQTDTSGTIYFSEDYLVSGDAFYLDDEGRIVFPMGTLVIQEIKPSDGYLLNSEFIIREIKGDGYEIPTVKEQVTKLVIAKQNTQGEKLEGAEFTVYKDAECTDAVTTGVTDENGSLIMLGLTADTTYYVKETAAPEGYTLSETVYEVVADGSTYTILNEKEIVLPDTGGGGMLLLEMAGIGCFMISLNEKRRKK